MKIIIKELQKYASFERKKSNERFFKTGKGQYGEGDVFIGVRVPDIRKVAKKFLYLNLKEIQSLISSEVHEVRLAGVLILVEQFKRGNEEEKARIYKFYLENKKWVNNWDLVDLSSLHIVGQYLLDNPSEKKILDELVVSKILWDRRIAIISTWAFIRNDHFLDTLRLSKKLLGDKEDLIHKAVGWMLREVWKKDTKVCEEFLIQNYSNIPRTALRYAIERMDEGKRKGFLRREF